MSRNYGYGTNVNEQGTRKSRLFGSSAFKFSSDHANLKGGKYSQTLVMTPSCLARKAWNARGPWRSSNLLRVINRASVESISQAVFEPHIPAYQSLVSLWCLA